VGGSRWGRLRPGGAAPGDGSATSAGLEPGCGDVVLPVGQLEQEVVEAVLEDGVGAIIEGQEGVVCGHLGGTKHIPRPTAPRAGPLAASVPGHRKIL
jgi:hypothetical protein